jgi:hypothetical protein
MARPREPTELLVLTGGHRPDRHARRRHAPRSPRMFRATMNSGVKGTRRAVQSEGGAGSGCAEYRRAAAVLGWGHPPVPLRDALPLAAPGRTHHARPKPGDGQELAQRKRRALTGLVRIILGTMLQVIVTLRTMPLWS